MNIGLITAILVGISGAVFAGPSNLVQTVTYNGETVTMRLTRQSLRGPYFELWVQNTNGTYAAVTPVEERSYLGTVDGYPDAMASGILQDNGIFRGQIDFNRGGAWLTLGTSVFSTRGLSQPSTFGYPGWTTAPGQAGTNMYRFDVGVDANYNYFNVRGGSDVAKTFERIELSVAVTRAMYMQNALLRPYLSRVIIRASQTNDPAYGKTAGNYLDAVRNEWNNNQGSANRDVVAGVSPWDVGGGLAWVGVIGTSSAYSVSDDNGDGDFSQVWRHEMGHNWGLGHYDGGAPEGDTINSNNQFSRMSGPELYNALAHRNGRLGFFNNEGVYAAVNIPPYAAIDGRSFVQTVDVPITIDVKANDHDANGDSLSLLSFDAKTAKGGTVSQQGQSLIYAPRGDFLGTDSFTYTILDARGQKATGAVAVNVSVPTTLRAYWALNETAGTSAVDQSTYGNNGTLYGGATFSTNSVPGRFGNALQFDGADDHVAFELGPSLSGKTDFTICAWIKTSAATNQVIIQQRDWRGYDGEYQFRVNANGTLGFMIYGNGAFQFDFSTAATVNDGQWHFVSAVRSGTNGYIYVDTNPSPAASTNGPLRDLNNGIGVVMGRDNRDGISNFNGLMDEVRLYDVALSPAAITALARGGGATLPSPFDGATQVSVGSLSWTAGLAAVSNRVYLGASQTAVAAANTGSPEYQGSTAAPAWVFNPQPNTTYYWRIDTVTASNTVAGPVWRFTAGSEVFDSSLVGMWKLDDASGLTASDASPNGKHGTLWGGPVWTTGRRNGALQFNGAGDHVAFELGPSLSGQADFTVSAWIRTSSATDQVILQQRDWRGWNGEYQFRVNANGTLKFWLYGNEAYQFDFNTTSTVNDGEWHFVSAVRSGSNGYIYIDGNAVPAGSASGPIRDLSNGLGVVLGRDSRDGINNFNGRIDEVRLYRRALSGSELTAIRSSYIVAPIININGPGAGESAVAISWASESGQTYGVQTNSTLGSTNWGLFMSNIPGNGGTLAVTNIMGPNPTYYRVLTE